MKTREPEDEHCVLQCTFIYATLYPKTTLRFTHTPSTAIHNNNSVKLLKMSQWSSTTQTKIHLFNRESQDNNI